jgi:ubiquinone/menaquinone biosynthesis C-methylase UbiE
MATARDPTFAKFTANEGKAYAASRGISYPPKVFQEILDYHGGATELAVDVGCGPGNVTRDLTKYFDKVVGLDNSQGMVDAADSVMELEPNERIAFRVCPAERIDENGELERGSVDVITSAVAVSVVISSMTYIDEAVSNCTSRRASRCLDIG